MRRSLILLENAARKPRVAYRPTAFAKAIGVEESQPEGKNLERKRQERKQDYNTEREITGALVRDRMAQMARHTAVKNTAPGKLPPVKIVIPHGQTRKEDSIRGLEDYSEHFKLGGMVKASGLPQEKQEVLLSIVDAFSLNPTFSLEQKRKSLQVAIDFLWGNKYDFTLQSLEGTEQAKSYAQLK